MCSPQPHHGLHLQVLLLVLPGSAKATQVDEAGLSSLAVLRLMGLPALQVLVQGQAGASLKERSAAKKRALAAVASQVTEEIPQDTELYTLHVGFQTSQATHTWWLLACMHEQQPQSIGALLPWAAYRQESAHLHMLY